MYVSVNLFIYVCYSNNVHEVGHLTPIYIHHNAVYQILNSKMYPMMYFTFVYSHCLLYHPICRVRPSIRFCFGSRGRLLGGPGVMIYSEMLEQTNYHVQRTGVTRGVVTP